MQKALKALVDYDLPLTNVRQEEFCQEYLRLTLDGIETTKYKKISAYKTAYQPSELAPSIIEQRANAILHSYDVQRRLEALLTTHESSVESKYKWIKSNSEDKLVRMINDSETKDADRLKAIQLLNDLKGIKGPVELVEHKENDALTRFLNKVGL